MSSLEKALCLLLILALASLAGLFLRDLRTTRQDNPFTVDPKLLSQAARPPEAVAANYLLPSGNLARRVAAPAVLSPADLSQKNPALADVSSKYHRKRVLLASYDVAGALLTAAAIDTESPEWAFGLWAARRPAGARPLQAGSAQAWRTDAAAGFWAGTYYVEISQEPPAASLPQAPSEPAPDPLAILLAEIGRAYVPHGRPFAGEALLPEQGLKADSLRLTPEAVFGLGVESLRPALIADYESDAKVAVVTLASADLAKTALKTLQKTLAAADPEAESEGRTTPPPDAQDRLSGPLPDGRKVVAQAIDRFVVAAAAPQALQATALLDQIQPAQIAQKTASAAAAGASKAAAEGPLPKLQDAELSGPGEIRRFNADTLYEKIDGKAQLYLSYSFAELLFTTYTAGDASLDVYVYDMGQADNAFGIYKAEEGENSDPVEIGGGGYASGASIFFWKGKHYVNILAGGEEAGHGSEAGGSTKQKELTLKLAAAIAAQLKDSGQSLWAEQILPRDNRVAGSFEFRKSDAFGLDFLKDVFSARYKASGKDLTLFILRQNAPEKAAQILTQYEAFAGKYGKVLETGDLAGGKILVVQSSGTYDVVFLKDKYFGGATAADDREVARSVVAKWLQDLGTAPAK